MTGFGRVGFLGLALLAVVAVPDRSAAAQSAAPAVSAGVGVSVISKTSADGDQSGPHLQASYEFGARPRWVIGAGVFGLRDERPLVSDFAADGSLVREPSIFRTLTFTVGAEFPVGSLYYVRPGAGLGRHSFAVYDFDADGPVRADTSAETGLVYGVVFGRAFSLRRRADLRVEGFVLWSRGEDSSGSRRVIGVTVAPRFWLR